MKVVLLNDTRCDPNPGCQATVSTLVRLLSTALDAQVMTRPRGEGYEHFSAMARDGRARSRLAWGHGVDALAGTKTLLDALASADLVVANLEGTFHHHTVGALALGGAVALAHRVGTPVWAVNGSVQDIEPWLLADTLAPAAHVAVREPWSARWLHVHGVPATVAGDAAFLAETFTARQRAPAADTTRAFYTPGVRHATTLAPDLAEAEVLADLDTLAAAGWTPVFVQFEDREAPLADAATRHGWPTADARAVPWHTFGAYLRQFSLVVSGRYHALIFAAMAGVPLVARPSNTHKIEGLLDLLECSHALAHDTAALRTMLAADQMARVDEPVIRRCQTLARGNVPRHAGIGGAACRPSAARAVPIVEGLDWTPDVDLPGVLTQLRLSAPPLFQTSVATRPGGSGGTATTPVRSAASWRTLLCDAGLKVTHERIVPGEQADADAQTPAAQVWTLVNPLGDRAIAARRVFTVRKTASVGPLARLPRAAVGAGLPAALRDGQVHVRLVIGDSPSFARLAPIWRGLPQGACSVVLRVEPSDAAWHDEQRCIAAWCASEGLPVWSTDDPRALPWQVPTPRRVLVVSGAPRPELRRTLQGAFLASARHHGWPTLIMPPEAGTAAARACDGPTCGVVTLTGALDRHHRRHDTAHDHNTGPLRVALFGASSLGRSVAARLHSMAGLELTSVLDNDATKWETSLDGVTIVKPDAAALGAADVVLVSSVHGDAIARQVIDAGHGHKLVFDPRALEWAATTA